MNDSQTPSSPRPPRMRVSELCEREGISRATAWRWVGKGLLDVSRRGPRTGVRVSYPTSDDHDDDLD
jgi:predicted site-specific integrase-resolvase